VRETFNLLVDLDERFDDGARADALQRIERNGLRAFEGSADDRFLSWIDDVFGGSWSSEAYAGQNVIAYDGDVPVGFATFDPKGLRFAWLRDAAREPGVGIFGPFGVDRDHRGREIGPALLTCALAGLKRLGYSRALIPAVGDERLRAYYTEHAGARVVERFDLSSLVEKPVRTVVLASGNGSNFQSVIDRVADGGLPLDVVALVTNNPNAFAIERARNANVATTHVLPWKRKEVTRETYDASLLDAVAGETPDLVLLLGWMHILAPTFVDAFPELINVHPGFLPLDPHADRVGLPDGTVIPAFRGAKAVHDALAYGSTWIGASVHAVTNEADRGEVFTRKPLRVLPNEPIDDLMERLHPLEHQLLERGIRRWLYER
jgi:folate-dependent phosphoribosylglycinamide formyltransferase PurN/predicted N-acetyltransferase YhbS